MGVVKFGGLADYLLGQYTTSSSQAGADADNAAGCLACGGFFGFIAFIVIAGIAINIAILVWVARDAKNRGMDNGVVWMILVLFTGLIGLIIYLFARPQGNTIPCPSCNNKRLQILAKCPHCGNP